MRRECLLPLAGKCSGMPIVGDRHFPADCISSLCLDRSCCDPFLHKEIRFTHNYCLCRCYRCQGQCSSCMIRVIIGSIGIIIQTNTVLVGGNIGNSHIVIYLESRKCCSIEITKVKTDHLGILGNNRRIVCHRHSCTYNDLYIRAVKIKPYRQCIMYDNIFGEAFWYASFDTIVYLLTNGVISLCRDKFFGQYSFIHHYGCMIISMIIVYISSAPVSCAFAIELPWILQNQSIQDTCRTIKSRQRCCLEFRSIGQYLRKVCCRLDHCIICDRDTFTSIQSVNRPVQILSDNTHIDCCSCGSGINRIGTVRQNFIRQTVWNGPLKPACCSVGVMTLVIFIITDFECIGQGCTHFYTALADCFCDRR